MTTAPDYANPNREPVISIFDLARLDDAEVLEGYRDGAEGLLCGDNRSRSYWHGWRGGARDGGHREGDVWDRILTGAVCPKGRGLDTLRARVEEARAIIRKSERL